MSFQRKQSDEPRIDLTPMVDVVFLLLIFFMLTASFVTPSGLPVNLPSSKSSTIVMQKVSVTITKDLRYFVDDQRTNIRRLPDDLAAALKGQEGVVVLHVDKSVPTEHLINVASIATSLKARVSVATRPME